MVTVGYAKKARFLSIKLIYIYIYLSIVTVGLAKEARFLSIKLTPSSAKYASKFSEEPKYQDLNLSIEKLKIHYF